ncbi:hypothetical protein [Rhizobium leguminosarum]|uniref:Uncharacterized protein n=1 Tax=Rhizobium leguminosarum TaxID=384 RepID=A0A1B1CHZ4_RHILE|nr:hypothetical protein [Rhizobium leguminosarum]ANP89279.1 hypothetical protein BA011_26205 [Rhizobium leguminosarum]
MPPDEPPVELDDENEQFEKIKEKTSEAARRLADRRKDVQSASRTTLTWLKTNKEFYQADGSLSTEPWWEKVSDTEDPILTDLRDFFFRCHLFDNGIRHMVNLLKSKDVLRVDGGIKREIKFAVDYRTMGLHHELMGYVASNKGTSIKLTDLVKRYDVSNKAYLRDRRVIPMSQLGMWKCRATEAGYQISIGILAEEFHRNAFHPIKAAFDPSSGTFDPDSVVSPK